MSVGLVILDLEGVILPDLLVGEGELRYTGDGRDIDSTDNL